MQYTSSYIINCGRFYFGNHFTSGDFPHNQQFDAPTPAIAQITALKIAEELADRHEINPVTRRTLVELLDIEGPKGKIPLPSTPIVVRTAADKPTWEIVDPRSFLARLE
ncbi:MAG: hypothetical protein Q7R56_02540 [Nanoarchaeota archaeon]|nr:hypothetical protein [Nanoarchaeota archaeon]